MWRLSLETELFNDQSCLECGAFSFPLSVCSPPTKPENGGFVCHPSPCQMFSHGTVIEFVCDEGFTVTGDYNYLVCEDGEWDSPMQTTCVSKGLSAVQPLSEMFVLSYFLHVYYITIPNCIFLPPGCIRPSAVQHGSSNLTDTNGSRFPIGTVLQYSCDPGYVPVGRSILTCTTLGFWSSQPPHCIRSDGKGF